MMEQDEQTSPSLVYRELPCEDWWRLEPFFAERGQSLPHPQLAKIGVAEHDGEIVGFLVNQLIPHTEPLSIAPDWRGKVSWKRLLKLVESHKSYVFADSPERERMLKLGGFTKIPHFTVWIKEKAEPKE